MVLAIAWNIQVKVGFRIFGPDVRWYVVKGAESLFFRGGVP